MHMRPPRMGSLAEQVPGNYGDNGSRMAAKNRATFAERNPIIAPRASVRREA